MHPIRSRHAVLVTAAACVLLSACAARGPASPTQPATSAVPDAVRVPSGHRVKLETVGIGELTYECRTRAAGGFEWAFAGPKATLTDRQGRMVGTYYGGPTWEGTDGSKVTGKQLAVAPGRPDAIPLQLVRVENAPMQGAMSGVSYIQRLDTRGGTPPAMTCGDANLGEKRQVKYQADYVLWTPA
jgi:hypothetical protein